VYVWQRQGEQASARTEWRGTRPGPVGGRTDSVPYAKVIGMKAGVEAHSVKIPRAHAQLMYSQARVRAATMPACTQARPASNQPGALRQ
jgi:hypothetical protein